MPKPKTDKPNHARPHHVSKAQARERAKVDEATTKRVTKPTRRAAMSDREREADSALTALRRALPKSEQAIFKNLGALLELGQGTEAVWRLTMAVSALMVRELARAADAEVTAEGLDARLASIRGVANVLNRMLQTATKCAANHYVENAAKMPSRVELVLVGGDEHDPMTAGADSYQAALAASLAALDPATPPN